MFIFLEAQIFLKKTYRGFTTDLKSSFKDHNNGKSKHTAKYALWELISYHAFAEERKAREFEYYLKTGSGKAFAKKRLL